MVRRPFSFMRIEIINVPTSCQRKQQSFSRWYAAATLVLLSVILGSSALAQQPVLTRPRRFYALWRQSQGDDPDPEQCQHGHLWPSLQRADRLSGTRPAPL